MWGPANALLEENLSSDQQGLTPRVFERLFSRINEVRLTLSGYHFWCQVPSFVVKQDKKFNKTEFELSSDVHMLVTYVIYLL